MPTIDMQATGQNIKRLKDNAGISVKDMQDIFGFASGNAIYKWMHGQSLPTIDNLVVLADMFGTTIDSIIMIRR